MSFYFPQDVGVKAENPVVGQVYLEIEEDTWWVYEGEGWVRLAAQACPTCHRPY